MQHCEAEQPSRPKKELLKEPLSPLALCSVSPSAKAPGTKASTYTGRWTHPPYSTSSFPTSHHSLVKPEDKIPDFP